VEAEPLAPSALEKIGPDPGSRTVQGREGQGPPEEEQEKRLGGGERWRIQCARLVEEGGVRWEDRL
jgi:hypothetical protein